MLLDEETATRFPQPQRDSFFRNRAVDGGVFGVFDVRPELTEDPLHPWKRFFVKATFFGILP